MLSDNIPPDISAFISDYVESVAYMEALVLLTGSEDGWNVAALAERLYIGKAEARSILKNMGKQGLVIAKSDRFVFAPASRELGDTARRSIQFYSKALVPFTHMIHARRVNRVQQFADAFQLKKTPK